MAVSAGDLRHGFAGAGAKGIAAVVGTGNAAGDHRRGDPVLRQLPVRLPR